MPIILKINDMKKLMPFFALSLIVSVGVISCGKKLSPEEEVRDYGKYFVAKLNANQLDFLKAGYPDIVKADSLIPVQSDTIMVMESAPGQYDVTLAEGITLKMSRSDDGKISVTESRGLFAFPADKIDIARKTGMWDDNLSDAQLNERMKDDEFFKFIKNTKLDASKFITIGKVKPGGNNYYLNFYDYYRQNLTNNTNTPINGTDYKVKINKSANYGNSSGGRSWYERSYTIPGKSIPPHSTTTYILKSTEFPEELEIIDIIWNLSPEQLQEKFGAYTGKEYQEYLESKK